MQRNGYKEYITESAELLPGVYREEGTARHSGSTGWPARPSACWVPPTHWWDDVPWRLESLPGCTRDRPECGLHQLSPKIFFQHPRGSAFAARIGRGRQESAVPSYKTRKAWHVEGKPDRKGVSPRAHTIGRKTQKCPMMKGQLNHKEQWKRSQKATGGNWQLYSTHYY